MELSFQKIRTLKTKNDPISFGKNLFSNGGSLNGYELLAIAVVNQAAEDYRRALKTKNSTERLLLERFFHSDWGDLLCFGMGDLIVEKLQKEFESGKRIKTKPYFSAKRGVGRRFE